MTGSVNSRLPDPAVLDYGAAKAALAGFAQALSKEVGPHGIRVNTVSPGPVATEVWLGGNGVTATGPLRTARTRLRSRLRGVSEGVQVLDPADRQSARSPRTTSPLSLDLAARRPPSALLSQ